MKTPTLETERIILRPLTIADAKEAFENWTHDDRVTKYMRYNSHNTVNDTKDWLKTEEDSLLSDKQYSWGFVEKENRSLFGSGGLVYNEDQKMFEIGYNIMYDYWHQGYTTEIAGALIDFVKNTLQEKQLYGCHAVENIYSGKVMEKHGFEPTGYCIVKNFDGTTKRAKSYLLKF